LIFTASTGISQTVSQAKSSISLYADGIRALKKSNYPQAGEDFDSVLKQARKTSGEYFLLTTLREGDVFLFQGQYSQAISKYKRFIDSVEDKASLPNMDYAYYRLIQAHWLSKGENFFLVPPMDRREQLEINAAYGLARKFITRFPNSPYMPEVMDIYRQVSDTRISFEMEVARFYLNRKKPMGAVFRLKRLLKDVPVAGYSKEVVHRYIHSLNKAGKIEDLKRNCIKYRAVLGNESLCKG